MMNDFDREFPDCIESCDRHNLVNPLATQCGGISFTPSQAQDNCLLKVGDAIGNQPGVWSARLVSRMVNPGGNPGITATVSGSGTNPGVTATISDGSGSGPGTGPGQTAYVPSTVVSTALSISVSNGITYTSIVGVTTIVSVSYIQQTASTVTTTSISLRPTIIPTTIQQTIDRTITGPGGFTTVTQGGGTATFTQVGPTVTASGSGGSPPVTVTLGNGGGGGGVVTSIIYVYPSSTSSTSTCRLTPTNYYKGLQPARRDLERKFDLFAGLPARPMPRKVPDVWR